MGIPSLYTLIAGLIPILYQLGCCALAFALQQSQPDLQRGQRLPGFVVQLVSNIAPLLLLSLDQPAGQPLELMPVMDGLTKQSGPYDIACIAMSNGNRESYRCGLLSLRCLV
jgi:hypothetical protein